MIAKYSYDEDIGLVMPKKMKSLQKIRTLEPIRYEEGYTGRRIEEEYE